MDRAAFFDYLRRSDVGMFGRSLSESEVEGCEAVLDECERAGADLGQTAYILATAYGETGGQMQPRRENMNYTAKRIRDVWPSRFPSVAAARPYERNPVGLANKVYNGRMGNRVGSQDGWNYRGNGVGQITGRDNHKKWSKRLGVDLVGNPEILEDLIESVRALVVPMLEGWATGHKLSEFVSGEKRLYRDARRVWNGTFEADRYAGYAGVFERALEAADWGAVEPPHPDWVHGPAETPKGAVAALVALLLGAFVIFKRK